jgi:cytochrome bd ubiquinol oxidase subunit II
VGGCLAVATCVFLAGVFLTADAARAGDIDLADSLRLRTLIVGIVTGLIVFAGLYPLAHDAPTLAAGLRSHASPLLAVALLSGLAAVVLVFRRRYAIARLPAAAAVGSVITGWGIGQYPWLLVDEVTINDAAGADATLTGLLIVVVLAGVVVVPALGYLLWLTQTEEWTRN